MAWKHGMSGYTNYGCRCDICRAAATAYRRKRTAERRLLLAADPTLVPHGRASTYGNWGCRCDPCRAAWRDASRTRPHRQPRAAA